MEQTKKTLCKLSIIVPVYRSETIIAKLVDAVQMAMCEQKLDGQFELLLVNDCSPDNSWSVIQQQVSRHAFVRGISLRRNFGQHNALMAGLHHAKGKFIVLMDDDLQHPPSEIGKMIQALESGYDVCYTNYINRRHVWWKKAGSAFNDRMANRLLGKPRGLYLSSFKAMRREVSDEVTSYDGPYVYLDGLILDVTRSITSIDIQHQERLEGDGNYTLMRCFSLYMGMATSFSILPLRIASGAGICLALGSLLMLIRVILSKLLNPDLPAGWPSLAAIILFIAGIQTLCLGVMGEYLGRIYLKINRKPQFVVAEVAEC